MSATMTIISRGFSVGSASNIAKSWSCNTSTSRIGLWQECKLRDLSPKLTTCLCWLLSICSSSWCSSKLRMSAWSWWSRVSRSTSTKASISWDSSCDNRYMLSRPSLPIEANKLLPTTSVCSSSTTFSSSEPFSCSVSPCTSEWSSCHTTCWRCFAAKRARNLRSRTSPQ